MKSKNDSELITERYDQIIEGGALPHKGQPVKIAYVEFGTRGDGDDVHKVFTNKQVQNIVDSNVDDRNAAVDQIADMYDGSKYGEFEYASYSDKVKVGNISMGETTALLVIFPDSLFYNKSKEQLATSLRHLDASL